MQRNRVDRPNAFVLNSVLLGPPLAALMFALSLIILTGVPGGEPNGNTAGGVFFILFWAIIGGYVLGTIPALLASMLVLLTQRVWRPLTIAEVAVVSTLMCIPCVLLLGVNSFTDPSALTMVMSVAVAGGLTAAVLWFICVRNGWCYTPDKLART